jgi:mycoredoxin
MSRSDTTMRALLAASLLVSASLPVSAAEPVLTNAFGAPIKREMVADDPVPAGLRAIVGDSPVVILSASDCGYCVRLRKALDAAGLHYLDLDINADPRGTRARALLPGGQFVPVTIVGDGVVYGDDPERIIALSRH